MVRVPFNQRNASLETYSYDIGRAPVVVACKATGLYAHAQQIERMPTSDFLWAYDIIRAIARRGLTVSSSLTEIGQEIRSCYDIAMVLQQVRIPCYAAINYMYMAEHGEPLILADDVAVNNSWPNEAGMSLYDTQQLEFINVATAYLDHQYQNRHTDFQVGDSELTKQMALNHLANPEQHDRLRRLLDQVVDEGRHFPALVDLL